MGRSAISAVVLAAAIAYALGIWLFLVRAQDPLPARADAVFVLAGSKTRLPVAQKLIRDGIAKTLVVSEASDAPHDPARYALCRGARPKGYKLICRTASPYSTRGEARLLASLVRQYRWSSVIVVSSHYHLFRAHLLARRCTQAELIMRGSDGDAWWSKALAIPLEYGKLIRAKVWQRDC